MGDRRVAMSIRAWGHRLRSWSRSRQAGIGVAVVVVLAVVAGALTQAGPGGAPNASAGASPGASGEAAASPSGASEWTAVQIPDLPAIADLTPLQEDETGIRPDGVFSLASLTDEPAVDVARRLVTSPSVALTVTSGASASQALVRPDAPLDAGQDYRFALRGADGILQGSWTFRVRSSLHVLSTIPAPRSTAVPVNRAVELTFDQDGVADIAPYFSISPAVSGRFERHGRTQVFVPDHLAPATLYTVTVRAGLPRTGTDLRLEQDVVVAFETSGGTSVTSGFGFGRDGVESSPTEAPVLGVVLLGSQQDSDQRSVDVVVYRYPNEAAAAQAYGDFLLAPRWTSYARPRLATAGLPVVTRFTATLETAIDPQARTFRFPEPLPVGWYAVELPGPPTAYAFLQVTPVSAWTAVLTDRTVVWANDVRTHAAISGATVSLLGKAPFATTDAHGLAVSATPDDLVPPAEANGRGVPDSPPLVVVRSPGGAAVLVAFDVGFYPGIYRGDWSETVTSADGTYWELLYTDRELYRRSDRIEAWGYLRGRDDGATPSAVDLELHSLDGGAFGGPGLAGARATPTATGAYIATVAFDRLPYGWYVLQALVDGRVVSQTYVQVGAIRKPAYQLTITSDRRAIIVGQSVHLNVAAAFFDGSPVPDLGLHLIPSSSGELPLGKTGPGGTVDTTVKPPASDVGGTGTGSQWFVDVAPDGPEEGEISASTDVLVFPSTDYIVATGAVKAGTLTVSGSVRVVDVARVDRERAAGTWNGDPAGGVIAGRQVTVTITQLHQVRTQTGTYYDFLEKVVRPIYQYDTQRIALATTRTVSGADGAFTLSVPVPSDSDSYEVLLSSQDEAGRTELRRIYAGTEVAFSPPWAVPEFMASSVNAGAMRYAIGDRISWQITEDGAPPPQTAGTNYLYIVAQRGLLSATTSTSPSFARTFSATDAPGVFVMGIRFTGTTYAPKAAAWAMFKADTRRLTVTVDTDRATYRPGENVRLTLRVKDTAGRPTAADVLLQAVDEKLFAMGVASVPNPLAALYTLVDSGVVRLTATHQGPSAGPEGEGGATGGNATRTDFRDTLVSRLVHVAGDGVATTTVHLSDDLTSWHVLASALTGSLQAGVGEKLVPVGLPLFADVTLADEYLVADRPSIRLRAYGTALSSGDAVTWTVSAPSLGMPSTQLRGTAFADTMFALPALTTGQHAIDIMVTAPGRVGADGEPLTDHLIRTIEVVTSRVTAGATWYGIVGDSLPAIDATDLATYTFTDAGTGRYLPLLIDAGNATSARLDNAVARDVALGLLVEQFGMDSRTLPAANLDLDSYPISSGDPGSGLSAGVAIVPDGGPDPWLATRIAMLAPTTLATDRLRSALEQIRDGASTLRDLRIASLAGLAAIGEPAELDLREAAALTDLTPTERLDLAIGFLRLGDEATARTIEVGLLRQFGQRLGPWVRLQMTDDAATSEATALLAVVASGVGDPLASALSDYAQAHPSKETSITLELVAASVLGLERTPRATARLGYTVDGSRTDATIEPGQSLTLTLTAAQRQSLRLEPLTGDIGLAISWRRALDVNAVTRDPALQLTRTLPTGPLPPTKVVTVDLQVTFGPAALDGCYEVVEEVPSGLAPIVSPWSSDSSVIWPMSVTGQEVRFCVPVSTSRRATLRYAARVVNAGTFVWEPAVMQHDIVREAFTATGSGSVTIASQ